MLKSQIHKKLDFWNVLKMGEGQAEKSSIFE